MFCYVRGFERRADRPSDHRRYGTSIRLKVNIAGLLRAQLARKSRQGEGIAIGAATDPYQPAEGRYRLTRACLEVLCAASNSFSIITRGPLIVREPPLPSAGHPRALPRVPRTRLAGAAPGLRGPLRARPLPGAIRRGACPERGAQAREGGGDPRPPPRAAPAETAS